MESENQMRHPFRALVLVLAFSACGTPASEPQTNSFDISAIDDGFRAPDAVAAGPAHITFTNDGSDTHEMMFVRLPAGMTGANYLDLVRGGEPFPDGAKDFSGPGLTSPGLTVQVWLDLDPGRYLLACWYRGHLTDLDPHVLIVEERPTTSPPPPAPDVTIRMVDFAFNVEGGFRRGEQVIRVETIGPSMHELDMFRLHDDATIEDLEAWQDADKVGSAPADPVGGVLDSHDLSRVVSLRVDLEPGRYVLWCNMDGPTEDLSHARAGMRHEFVVS